MSANLIQDVEKQRHRVVVDNFTPTWNELLDQFRHRDVQIDPVYQRAFRWTLRQQTRYIESILLNIPTPPVFLAEMPDGKFEVIDGLQRFSTMVKFFAAEVFRDDEVATGAPSKNVENDIHVPTILTDAPILKGLEGLTRDTLPETLVRTLRYARTQAILLKKESSPLARYHVFTRLNRAGSTLSDQEIRNCSARLFNSAFADKLMVLGQDERVARALDLSAAESHAMGAQENVLRLVAFCHFSPTTQRIDEFLDDAMYKVAAGEFKFTDKIEQGIYTTFELISSACPNGEAFRFYRNGAFKGAFSSNLFDIVACGVYKNVRKVRGWSSGQLRNRIVDLHSQADALALTGAGSNTRAKMKGRVSFGERWFAAHE